MSDRVAMLLARRAEVFDALSARRRLMWSWGAQIGVWGVMFGGVQLGLISALWVPLLLIVSGGVLAWSAVEAALLQRAMREPGGVVVMTLIGHLMPPAAVVLAGVLLWESVAVLRIAQRLKQKRCARCGYDLAGIDGRVCPECGWETGEKARRHRGTKALRSGER